MNPVLELSGVTVRFGGLVALRDVCLAIHEGETVGLIGPNGAGKSTLIDAVTGFTRYEGSVMLSGDRIDALRPDQRAARGLRRTFQSLELFEDLTVRENVAVATEGSTSAVAAAMAATGLTSVADRLPPTLSPQNRRFTALARAIAAGPRMLLLDEVAAGLDGEGRSSLVARLRDVVSSGSSVLVVDHDLSLVAEVCQRVVVLDAGRVIASGPPEDVGRDELVRAAYLGEPR